MFHIDENSFIECIKTGCDATSDFMHRVTNYHGGPTATEYILTADIARAFLEKNDAVQVEYLNKNAAGLNAKPVGGYEMIKNLKNIRTDIAIGDDHVLSALIEIKIGIKNSLRLIENDLFKMIRTLECIKANHASKILCASVFQTNIIGNLDDNTNIRLKDKIKKREIKWKEQLDKLAGKYCNYNFRLVDLQAEDSGYSIAKAHPFSFMHNEFGELVPDEWEMGPAGQVTRYYAVLMKSIRSMTDDDLETYVKKLRFPK